MTGPVKVLAPKFNHAADVGEVVLKCEAAYPGVVMGRAYVIADEFKIPEDAPVAESLRGQEKQRFAGALVRALADIEERQKDIVHLPIEARAEAQLMVSVNMGMLKDKRGLIDPINQLIEGGKTADFAVYKGFSSCIEKYKAKGSKAFASEADAMMCVMLQHLSMHEQPRALAKAPDGSIPVIRSINIGEAHLMRSKTPEGGSRIRGVINWEGSRNDHFNIIARAAEVTVAIASQVDVSQHIKHDDLVIIDGKSGEIIVNPSADTRAKFAKDIAKHQRTDNAFLEKSQADEHWTRTLDGKTIKVGANIGHSDEFIDVVHVGAHAVGLVRTETAVHMRTTSLPSQQDWYDIFKTYAHKAQGRKITIRTVDVDGDKKFPLIPNKEKQDEVTYNQMAAAARVASEVGMDKIAVMIPLVRSAQQLHRYQEMMNKAAGQYEVQSLKIGAMVELRIFVDEFASVEGGPDAAFYSIGTNDLIPSCMDYNRFDNDEAKRLCDPTNPRVLKTIKKTVEYGAGWRKNAEDRKVKTGPEVVVSVCGDLASDPKYFALLIGAGVGKLSAGSARVPEIKELVRRIDTVQARSLFEKVRAIKGDHMRPERERILFEFNKKYLGVNPDGTIDLDWARPEAEIITKPSVQQTEGGSLAIA